MPTSGIATYITHVFHKTVLSVHNDLNLEFLNNFSDLFPKFERFRQGASDLLTRCRDKPKT